MSKSQSLVAAGMALAMRQDQCGLRFRLASSVGEGVQQGKNGGIGEGDS
jgi:hypothetical protein